jgi:hypothetical protein
VGTTEKAVAIRMADDFRMRAGFYGGFRAKLAGN